jgi:CRISPR type III-A-associated RAMP protein Csm4
MLRLHVSINNLDESKLPKILKKVEYIEKNIFEDIINGNERIIEKNQISENGKFITSTFIENMLVYKAETQERVAIPENRETDPTPYSVERLYFSKEGGLYFFIQCNDKKTEKNIEICLNILSDTGFGTYRSVGNGNFKYTFSEIEIKIPDDFDSLINLSLYLPEKSELSVQMLDNSSYQITKRGGYISGSDNVDFIQLRKKSIYMFTEGSVFRSRSLTGKSENIKPEYKNMHDVWRDGKAFFIPLKSI